MNGVKSVRLVKNDCSDDFWSVLYENGKREEIPMMGISNELEKKLQNLAKGNNPS